MNTWIAPSFPTNPNKYFNKDAVTKPRKKMIPKKFLHTVFTLWLAAQTQLDTKTTAIIIS